MSSVCWASAGISMVQSAIGTFIAISKTMSRDPLYSPCTPITSVKKNASTFARSAFLARSTHRSNPLYPTLPPSGWRQLPWKLCPIASITSRVKIILFAICTTV